ncbi:MAG: HAD family phosphatase [Phycisphaeraceae bacterium]|nr:HAD family phosphatase [Phycisphaeraceae bacterium]
MSDLGGCEAVICDIDGCLAPESSGPMHAEVLARIARWNRASIERGGPILTVCSGRPQPFAEAMCRLLGNDRLPCIAENGVWLYDPKTNRYERDPAITPEHLQAVHEVARWVEQELSPRGVVMQPGKSASVSLYHPDPEYLRSTIRPIVETAFRVCGWPLRVSMTWLYINCDLAHVSKGSGIDRLCAAAGLQRDRLVGIGDTLSDEAIADRVAWFACPANADPRLKARAHFLASEPEAMGVLEILSRLT